MKKKTVALIAGGAIASASVAGAGIAISSTDDDGTEVPITGVELERATKAALEHTGGGTVTETELGDEESLYEVEVTLDDGSQVDVQLDEGFNVVDVMADDDTDEDAD
jgi:uncharacterized membrane protein YkoI